MANVSYSMFLDCLKVEGHVHEDGKEMKYEQDDEESPATCVKEASETAPFSSSLALLSDPKSSFRERDMNILCKPYNRNEYEELGQKANYWKLITYYRETLENFIHYTVPAGHFGKSYLGYHLATPGPISADLQGKIEVVQPDHYSL
ncbi:hypothetical protein Ancab_037362 [Ancistrocladus abbreviatus]